MKKYFKLDINLKQVFKIFIMTFIVCSVALILVSMIPDKNIDENIERSIEIMNKEGEYPIIMNKETNYFQIDNWTEATLLNFIYNCDPNEPLECTFAQKTYAGVGNGLNSSGLNDANLMIKEISPNSDYDGQKIGQYFLRSSYWLGVRIIYVPLLVIMNYYSIRYLVIGIGVFLSIFTLIKLAEKIDWKYALAFGISLLTTNYFTGLFLATHAFVYILTFLGMDYILLSKKKINYFNFMFIIGMLTTFLDWFSFPLISWGFITITILLKEYKENRKIKFHEFFNIIFNSAIAWCLGYASLLIFRVLFSYLVAGKDAIQYFMNRVSTNTGVENNSMLHDAYYALKYCFNGILPIQITNKFQFLLVLGSIEIIILIMCIYLIKRKINIGLPLSIISFSPMVWIVVFNKFHVVHWWFAYRSLGIYVFAVFLIFIIFLEEFINDFKKIKIWKIFKKKLSSTSIVKFLVIGGVSTLIDYIIYMLISLKINIVASKLISMTCASIFSFIKNKSWTFNVKEKTNSKMVLSYIIVQLINIGTNTLVNYLVFSITNLKTISFIVATFIAMVVNYLLQKFIVFKGEKRI